MSVKNLTADVLVIGGGINGVGIARDLAGRGLSVVLCEQEDLANATSSASTKIVHGGLRYLEHYDFKLVRESLMEREVLLRSAPHIIWPLDFVMPHNKDMRPYWLIRMGLFLYDYLAPREYLPGSEGLNFSKHPVGAPIKDKYKRGVMYADCWVEDSRLVVINAMDARERGAKILTRTKCKTVRKKRGSHVWRATLEDKVHNREVFVDADCVVNAAGPWVDKVIDGIDKNLATLRTRLVKGSHIVVEKLFEGPQSYILQNDDGRIVFAIPYEQNFTLIGTTDEEYKGNPSEVKISKDEVAYLCKAVNTYFKRQIAREDVVWAYSGVRPLVEDGESSASKVTRDYILDLKDYQGLPVLNVYGGKITTYRKLSEAAANLIAEKLGKRTEPWTEFAVLPGGDTNTIDFDVFYKAFCREFEWLPKDLSARYLRAYGSRARYFLKGARRIEDLGEHLGDDIYEAEVAYLVLKEWALTVEDIILRRSKWGLHITQDTEKAISRTVRKYKKRFAKPEASMSFREAREKKNERAAKAAVKSADLGPVTVKPKKIKKKKSKK